MEDILKAQQLIRDAENKLLQRGIVKDLSGLIVNELKPILEELIKPKPLPEIPEPKVTVNVPEIKVPEVNVPEIKIDTDKIAKVIEKSIEKSFKAVKIPETKITYKAPKIEIPPMPNFPEFMDIGLDKITRDKPLSVIIVDEKGKFVKLAPNISVSGFGGGAPSNSSFNGLSVPSYDYVLVEYPGATTETYNLKLGGSGGEIVCTLQMIYADVNKSKLKTVTKL